MTIIASQNIPAKTSQPPRDQPADSLPTSPSRTSRRVFSPQQKPQILLHDLAPQSHTNMFDHLKASVRARRQPRRPESAMPRIRHDRDDEEARSKQEQLDATMSVFAKIRRTGSLKDILHPPIVRMKPLTFSNLFASAKGDAKMSPVKEG